jgi:quinohemoprotein amine dehydrogenase
MLSLCWRILLLVTLAGPFPAAADPALLDRHCAGCHRPLEDGGLEGIAGRRTTPEGWAWTLARMSALPGARLSAAEQAELLRHFSRTQGLAPGESAPHRPFLEHPSAPADPYIAPAEPALAGACFGCHAPARIALERRTRSSWETLAHNHLGRDPLLEYRDAARRIPWWTLAASRLPARLADRQPHASDVWAGWRERPSPDLAGAWQFSGTHPGSGSYQGRMVLEAEGEDQYAYRVEVAYGEDRRVEGQGRAILYGGHEWRGRTEIEGSVSLQVLALDPETMVLQGRSFFAGQPAVGGRMTAVRADRGGIALLAVEPSSIKAGSRAAVRLTLGGGNLAADAGAALTPLLDFGPGLTVRAAERLRDGRIDVDLQADADAAPGPRRITIGEVVAEDGFAVYRRIDRLALEPPSARLVTADLGRLPPPGALFQAIGWLNGPDGAPRTGDDVALGPLAADFALEPAPAADGAADPDRHYLVRAAVEGEENRLVAAGALSLLRQGVTPPALLPPGVFPAAAGPADTR